MGHEQAAPTANERRGIWAWWTGTPLYQRIIGALLLALVVGVLLGESAAVLAQPAKLILRLLTAIAPPLILFAIVRALTSAELPAGTARRIAGLLLLNTLVAILIGLAVANLVRPGEWHELTPTPPGFTSKTSTGPIQQFLDNVPRSLLGPLTDQGNVIGVIFVA